MRAECGWPRIENANDRCLGAGRSFICPHGGRRLIQPMAQDLATFRGVTTLCGGRFEGVDERVMETLWHTEGAHLATLS